MPRSKKRKPPPTKSRRRPLSPLSPRRAEPLQTSIWWHVANPAERPTFTLPERQVDGHNLRQLRVQGEVAWDLEDLASVRLDMLFVSATCRLLTSLRDDIRADHDNGPYLQQMGFEAATIAYGRAFVEGVSTQGGATRRRRSLPRELERHVPEHLRDTHEQMLQLRNQHVGHRDNDWTNVMCLAFLYNDEHGRRGIQDVDATAITFVKGDLSLVGELAAFWVARLDERMRDDIDHLRSLLDDEPIDELYEHQYAAKPYVLRTTERLTDIADTPPNPDRQPRENAPTATDPYGSTRPRGS